MHRFGFLGSRTDPSLFILKTGRTLIYILVYVDYIIITCNDDAMIAYIIHQLGSTFSIKYLVQLHYFLGIEVSSRNSYLILSQRKYILDILHCSSLKDCKPVQSPMTITQVLSIGDNPLLSDPTIYR